MADAASSKASKPKVGLFVTCLVDLIRPSVGFATAKLIEDAGCELIVPRAQTCCGQPAYNSGDRAGAIKLAKQTIDAFKGCDYIVAPSGSCAGMASLHYSDLLADDPKWANRARDFARRTFELTAFLVDVMKVTGVSAAFDEDVTYHDSCAGLRELKVKAQPRKLLASVDGAHLKEMHDEEGCCGFGGTFCAKYPEISNEIVDRKIKNIVDTEADTLLAGDLGCLMNMAGKLSRQGSTIRVRHIAEVLAGMGDGPAIGEPQVSPDGEGEPLVSPETNDGDAP
jgi:L-lactate dehydrogenase complex protein LldE